MKQLGMAILISDKIDSRSKLTRRDHDEHYILIKGKIDQGDIVIVNIDAPNERVANFTKKKHNYI